MSTPITDLTHAGHWNIRKAKKETNKHSDEAPPVVFLHKAIPQRLRIFSFIYIHIWWFHVFLNCHNLRLCFMYQIIKKKKNKKQASQSSNTQTHTMEHKAIFPQCLRICSSIHIRVWQSQFFFKGCHNLRLCITQTFGHGAENKSKDSCKYSAMFQVDYVCWRLNSQLPQFATIAFCLWKDWFSARRRMCEEKLQVSGWEMGTGCVLANSPKLHQVWQPALTIPATRVSEKMGGVVN